MNQEEYFGEGSISRLSGILKRENAVKIFLVCGKKSFELSGAKEHINGLKSEFEFVLFDEFTENPKLSDVEKGVNEILKSKCDIVTAIGGGSVIDMAKLVNVYSCQNKPMNEFSGSETIILSKGKKLISIPTTSGAGSEATHFAVLYKGYDKYSVAHEFILPDVVILDPELTYNLPEKITAVSGIDAFSQAVESYWSVNSTDESKKYSSEAIRLITANLEKAVCNPNPESRAAMMKAANLAGKAINISKTTAPHALSYSMTSYFGVPHGQAVCISLSEFMKFNYNVNDTDCTDKRGAEFVRKSVCEIADFMKCKNVNEAAEKIKNMITNIGLETTLSGLGINSEESVRIIIENINLQRLNNNPRDITSSSLKELISKIL